MQVLVKKQKGKLKILSDRVEISMELSGKIIAVPFNTIKAQMANVVKDGGKIILKIVLHNEDSVSIQFNSIQDRETLSNALKSKINQVPVDADMQISIQARQDLLSQNPEWKQIHKDLVMSGMITEDEFWAVRADALKQHIFTLQQKRPTLSTLQADIKPTDGQTHNDIKFTLNSDKIHSIFTEYPGVHKAYLDHVPLKMTELEFWKLYFTSKWVTKTRKGNQEDIFDSYMKEEMNNELSTSAAGRNCENELLDLSKTDCDHLPTGNQGDFTMIAGGFKESIPLIKKFNRHSELILSSIKGQKRKFDFQFEIEQETVLEDLKKPKVDAGVQLFVDEMEMKVDNPSEPVSFRPINLQSLAFESLCRTSLIDIGVQNQEVKRPTQGLEECIDVKRAVDELLRHFWASFSVPARAVEIQRVLHQKLDQVETVCKKFGNGLLDDCLASMKLALSKKFI